MEWLLLSMGIMNDGGAYSSLTGDFVQLLVFPSTRGERSLIKEAATRSRRDRGLRCDIKIWPCLLDLGADGCVDLDEIFPSRPLDAASADLADPLPLRK